MPATDTTDSSSLGLDNPFGTSDTYANSNISTGSLPTSGSTYDNSNIATGSLPTGGTTYSGTTIDDPNAPPTSVSGDTTTDPTGTSASTGGLDWLKGLFSGSNINTAITGGAAMAAAQKQQADNAALAKKLSDQAQPILDSGQKQLAGYQDLTDLERKAMEAGVTGGQTQIGQADPLLGIGRTAFGDYTAGKLPAWQQAEIDAQVAQQKALMRQSLGANVDSTTLAQMEAQLDKQADIAKGNLLSQNLTAGEAAYKQGTDLTGSGNAAIKAAYDKASADVSRNLADALATITTGLGPMTDAINLEIRANSALAKAMTDLFSAMAKAGAGTGGGAGGGGIGGVISGGVKQIIDKFTGGGGDPKITPPSIDDQLKGIPKGPIEPVLPYTPPTGGPTGTVTPEEDPTIPQPTDPTGTSPVATDIAPVVAPAAAATVAAAATPTAAAGPTAFVGPEAIPGGPPLYAGDPVAPVAPESLAPPPEPPPPEPPAPEQPTAPSEPTAQPTEPPAQTSFADATTGQQLAELAGATGTAAAIYSSLAGPAVGHSAVLLYELGSSVPVATESTAAVVTGVSNALAATGATTAQTGAVASVASDAVASGASVSSALASAASVVLPVAIAAAVTYELFKALGLSDEIKQLSPEELNKKYTEKQAEEQAFYAANPEDAAKLQAAQATTAATTTPNASNTSAEELAALYQSAGGMDTGWPP